MGHLVGLDPRSKTKHEIEKYITEDFLVGAYIVSSSGAAAKLHGEKLGKFQKSKDCLGQ